jgi:hypothetical protein
MNFFNTRYYCNGYSHCQRVRARKAKFFTIYPQNGTILRLGSDPKGPNMAAPARASGRECDRSRDWERSRRADRRSLGRLAPSRRLNPVHMSITKDFTRRRVGWTNMKLPATTTGLQENERVSVERIVSASSRSWIESFRGSIQSAQSVSLGQICASIESKHR